MTICTAKDIMSAYTSIVSSLMADGWVISPMTASGAYCNVKHYIDLINYNDRSHLIRVWVYYTIQNLTPYGGYNYNDVVKVFAKKYKWDGKIKPQNCYPDYDGDGEYIADARVFYQIYESTNSRPSRRIQSLIFTEDVNEVGNIVKLRSERYLRKQCGKKVAVCSWEYSRDKVSANFIDRIMERINRVRGFKRATASCIESIKIFKDEDSEYGHRHKFSASVYYSFNGKSGQICLK